MLQIHEIITAKSLSIVDKYQFTYIAFDEVIFKSD